MTVSMTGFAARKGQGAGHSWLWDIRSVNGKGLDLRLRLPEGIEGLEAGVRAALGRALQRGNVGLALKVARETGAEGGPLRVHAPALAAALTALGEVESAAMARGVTLAQATAADVLALRGVWEAGAPEADTLALRAAILADLPALLASFTAMRQAEGAALGAVIAAQVAEIEALVAQAAAEAEARRAAAPDGLRAGVARLLAADAGIDPARLAQELALLAVKTDVTEEIDRLRAHLGAARSLLADPGQVGRKFDFLIQEFMREANTLCAKSQSLALTRIGLDLKTVIDQMREQVQNVE